MRIVRGWVASGGGRDREKGAVHNDTTVQRLTVHRAIHRRLVVIDNLVLMDHEGNLHLQRLDHIRLPVV